MLFPVSRLLLAWSHVHIALSTPTNSTIVSISNVLSYLLPPFHASSDLTSSWLATANTSSATTNTQLNPAAAANFVSYDDEFLTLIGEAPQLELIAERDFAIALEAGVWVWDRGEVWFTSSIELESENAVYILMLATNKIFRPNLTGDLLVSPNGGYYHDGQVYITAIGNATNNGGIVAINPATYEVRTVLNSWYGLRLNAIDDVTWARRIDSSYMFFTSIDDAAGASAYPAQSVFHALPNATLPNAIWRWDPQLCTLLPVIARSQVQLPNGIRTNAASTKLYVTDFAAQAFGAPAGAADWGNPATWVFDLDEKMFPTNGRLFAFARSAAADGIHLDDAGRVWTAEGDGIWVRDESGKVLGVINGAPLLASPKLPPIANFALAGDTLVVLAQTQIWKLKLGQQVVSAGDLT